MLSLVGSFLFFSDFAPLATFGDCVGGQVLSVDDVSIRTSSELGGRKVVRVLFSSLPSAECLDIRLSESQIENELNEEGFQVTNSIRGDIDLTKKNIEFGVNTRSTQKFIRFGEINLGTQLFCTDTDCRNEMSSRGMPTSTLIASIGSGGFLGIGNVCYCVFDDIRGINGAYTSGSTLKWEANVNIEGQGVTLNNGRLSGRIGSIAFVKWAGNLAGNTAFSSPNKDAIQSIATNRFSMIEDGVYYELNSARVGLTNILKSFSGSSGADASNALDSMRDYNARFDQLTRDELGSWINEEPSVSNAVFSGSKLIVDLASPIVYPQFTLDIDAEEVGIFITNGEPDITCPSKFDILSGDSFNARATLKNVGSASGSFSYFVDCNGGSQIISPTPPVSIGSGSSRTITITSGGISDSGIKSVSCKLTAVEINTLDEDSCFFGYDIEERQSCVVGQKSCELGNSELWECIDGKEFSKTDCDFGCEAFGATSRCRLQPEEICDNGRDDNGDGLTDTEDPACKGGIKNFFSSIGDWFSSLFAGIFGVLYAIKVLLIVVGLIFAVLFSKDALSEADAIKGKEGVQWALAILIGLLFAVILFLFIGGLLFWILLILGLVGLFFGARIKGALGL